MLNGRQINRKAQAQTQDERRSDYPQCPTYVSFYLHEPNFFKPAANIMKFATSSRFPSSIFIRNHPAAERFRRRLCFDAPAAKCSRRRLCFDRPAAKCSRRRLFFDAPAAKCSRRRLCFDAPAAECSRWRLCPDIITIRRNRRHILQPASSGKGYRRRGGHRRPTELR